MISCDSRLTLEQRSSWWNGWTPAGGLSYLQIHGPRFDGAAADLRVYECKLRTGGSDLVQSSHLRWQINGEMALVQAAKRGEAPSGGGVALIAALALALSSKRFTS